MSVCQSRVLTDLFKGHSFLLSVEVARIRVQLKIQPPLNTRNRFVVDAVDILSNFICKSVKIKTLPHPCPLHHALIGDGVVK